MELEELLDIMEYSFANHYENKTRFGLLQYFSLTEIVPKQLARIAAIEGKKSLARTLHVFNEQNFWNLRPLALDKSIDLLHSIQGHVVTPQEKLNVVTKLKEETYPLLEGTLTEGSRYYVQQGMDAISKKNIQKELLDSYHTYCENNQGMDNPAILTKRRERK